MKGLLSNIALKIFRPACMAAVAYFAQLLVNGSLFIFGELSAVNVFKIKPTLL